MSESGKSLFGNGKYGTWVSGVRVTSQDRSSVLSVDRSSPLKAFYSFLALGNAVRAGEYEMLEDAMDIIYFEQDQDKLVHAVKLDLVSTLYDVIDESLVDRLDFFKEGQNESHTIVLEQLGTDVTISLDFVQDAQSKEWMIKLPDEKVLQQKLNVLLAARGKYEVDPHSNLSLSTPRDTIRTFYEEYANWEEGGKKSVITTMNLSEVDPAIHEWQAPLLAYYLKSVLNRISPIVFQEIPNDPKSKKPYIHFHHAVGNIVLRPYVVEGVTKWQFTPETLLHIDTLYNEMENIKEIVPTKEIEDNNLYFKLKSTAKKISPLLLKKIKYSEIWQLFLLALIIIVALAISFFIRYVVIYFFRRFYITKRWTEEMITLRYIKPVQIGTFAMVLLYGAHQLGLPNVLFSIIKTFTHLLLVVSITWIVYNMISILFSMLLIRARKTSTNVDEIIVSLSGSILRILVITIALFAVAEIFSIPYKTVVAGLGIGGLAFAIAAKDTLANFFGSAIIIADRPFKTGDKIEIGSDIGVITEVGIRSTKIRTIHDTILTVPNNLITQEMIDNYSERNAMRIDTEFFFALDTPIEALNTLDTELSTLLKENENVVNDKIMLIGVNDFTKYGIRFGLSFFVKAKTDMQYSDMRHSVMTEIATLIKENHIEMVMINVEAEKI
jgi:small-conductance mechanosensitive channel